MTPQELARLKAMGELGAKAAGEIELLSVDRVELARLLEDRKTLDRIDAAAGGEDAVALIEAAKKLPLTRDGVRMVPTGHYWAWCRERYAEDADAYDLCEIIWWEGGGDHCFNPEYTLAPANRKDWEFFYLLDEQLYSTREAAEQAWEGGK